MTRVLFSANSSNQYVLSFLGDKTSLEALLHQGILKKKYVNINDNYKTLHIMNLLLTYNPLDLLGLVDVICPLGLVLAIFLMSARSGWKRNKII